MPVKSKRQMRFMGAIRSGYLKVPGLSKEKATEFMEETSKPKELPEKVKSSRFGKLKHSMKRA